MDIIQISGLHFAYQGEKEILKGADLTLEEGKFYILSGRSGCGKSTLLRHVKTALMPKGKRSGRIWKGVAEDEIGFVFQNPDNQIVTDKVWHELAFGMENLGLDQDTMHLRVAELAAYFGVEHWFEKDVSELSGGQKQLLNLAAVLALRPKLLILDEPVAWLDPMAAAEFLHTLYHIHRELGMTVLLSAHQLEEVISYGDELLLMEEGQIVLQGTPAEIGDGLRDGKEQFYMAMPVPMRVFLQAGGSGECPCTIADGRAWLRRELEEDGRMDSSDGMPAGTPEELQHPVYEAGGMPVAIKTKNLWFRYPDSGGDVLRGASFQVFRGEILGILGGNGSGKSTLLRIMSGILPAGRGKVQVCIDGKWTPIQRSAAEGRMVLLPQDVTGVFAEETVERELAGDNRDRDRWIELFHLQHLMERHPYDISGGEQQKTALVKTLLKGADIMLLDEPTKGMDAEDKRRLGDVLQELARAGRTIIMVSHDMEFTAAYAHRTGLFFRGKLEGVLPARDFFCRNYFYTTAAHRMGRELLPCAVTAEDVLTALAEPNKEKIMAADFHIESGRWDGGGDQEAFSQQKQIIHAETEGGFSVLETEEMDSPEDESGLKWGRLYIFGIFLLFPVLLWLGMTYFHDRRYLLISMGMVLYCLLPFFCLWEKRPPKVRKLVVVAVLAAIAVAGRCAFYMIPFIKPMAAVSIAAGVSLGAESGFFVGAVSMLVSNMLFGQGPWTPWQMLAMGLVGLFAGIIMHRDSFLKAGFLAQCTGMTVYGMLSVLCLYGGIMNPASLLMGAYEINSHNLFAIYLSGFPMDLLHGIATAAILCVAGVPVVKKLERMKMKYELE